MFQDANVQDLRGLIKDLGKFGIADNHKPAIAAATADLEAYAELGRLYRHAASFEAPPADGSRISDRLASGQTVSDAELIDYAAAATAAGLKIGPAAQTVIEGAANRRLKQARDTLRPAFPAIVADLNKYVTAATELDGRTRDEIVYDLKVIDRHAGRGVCDYWLVHDDRNGKWLVVVSADASRILDDNELYAVELKAQRKDAAEAAVRIDPPRKSRDARLRREPVPSSGFSGPQATADEIAAYREAKDRIHVSATNPRGDYTRAELERSYKQ